MRVEQCPYGDFRRQKVEVARQDANDLSFSAIERHRLADNCGIGVELQPPNLIAKDDTTVARFLVSFAKNSAVCSRQAEKLEESRSYSC